MHIDVQVTTEDFEDRRGGSIYHLVLAKRRASRTRRNARAQGQPQAAGSALAGDARAPESGSWRVSTAAARTSLEAEGEPDARLFAGLSPPQWPLPAATPGLLAVSAPRRLAFRRPEPRKGFHISGRRWSEHWGNAL